MVRKLTALVLLGLMMVVTATSQASVRYCLCLQTVFVSDCECHEPVSAGSCSRKNAEANGPCNCSEIDSDDGKSTGISLSEDCVIDLTVAIGDYPNSKEFAVSGKISSASLLVFSPSSKVDIPTFVRNYSLTGTRGPPRLLMAPPVPLFLRHSVFLV